MKLSPNQRTMLLNAKSYISTVSRQAELAKDVPLALALNEVVSELHRVMEIATMLPSTGSRVLKFPRAHGAPRTKRGDA